MQSEFINSSQNTTSHNSQSNSMQLAYANSLNNQKTFTFAVSFVGRMDMYSDADTVAKYLNAHEGWFCRCAQPMKVEPLGNNGYVLTVGKYGSFGYEVEPKMGVVLHPSVDNVYRMETIPLEDGDCLGYEVNYQASMELIEITDFKPQEHKSSLFARKRTIPDRITQVNWELDLSVEVEFPTFIHKLSTSLIQSTGDRLLAQIVRQVSPRLTYKVQQDFHLSHQLPMPLKTSRQLTKVDKSDRCVA